MTPGATPGVVQVGVGAPDGRAYERGEEKGGLELSGGQTNDLKF